MSVEIKFPDIYWLSRGRLHGELQDYVEVWAVQPERLTCTDGDIVWFAPIELIDTQDTCIGQLSIAAARARVGNGVPETDRELLRIGNPIVVAAEPAVS